MHRVMILHMFLVLLNISNIYILKNSELNIKFLKDSSQNPGLKIAFNKKTKKQKSRKSCQIAKNIL